VALQSEAPAGAATDLVGRHAELLAVREALAAAPPAGIVLEGEPGIGKTALWQAAVAEGVEGGMRLLSARPAEAESTLSHAALADLLSPLAEEVRHGIPAPQRHALDVALLRVAPDLGPVDAHAVGAATLAALRAVAGRTPVLLAIDDIQWLDPASAAAVRAGWATIRSRCSLRAAQRLERSGSTSGWQRSGSIGSSSARCSLTRSEESCTTSSANRSPAPRSPGWSRYRPATRITRSNSPGRRSGKRERPD
jgi:hypothetical protein